MSKNTKVTPFFRNWKEAGDDETFRRIDASIANQLEKTQVLLILDLYYRRFCATKQKCN